ncbi:MAG: PD-(D/E)XK nuclease-like domain-containing protein, partial [Sedimentisphaerales bacterium]|nr:PD-(D/E)XK nuclease-like domain-containing protein [Sedimentisphaerales bacterium]
TADLPWFENEVRRRRYHNQLAFYQALLAQVAGQWAPAYLVAVEKAEPFRCGVWRLGDETLTRARRENEAAIRRLRHCRETDDWPTGYEEIRILEVP